MPYFEEFIFGNLKVEVHIDKDGEILEVMEPLSGVELFLWDVKIIGPYNQEKYILHTFDKSIADCLEEYEEECRENKYK